MVLTTGRQAAGSTGRPNNFPSRMIATMRQNCMISNTGLDTMTETHLRSTRRTSWKTWYRNQLGSFHKTRSCKRLNAGSRADPTAYQFLTSCVKPLFPSFPITLLRKWPCCFTSILRNCSSGTDQQQRRPGNLAKHPGHLSNFLSHQQVNYRSESVWTIIFFEFSNDDINVSFESMATRDRYNDSLENL